MIAQLSASLASRALRVIISEKAEKADFMVKSGPGLLLTRKTEEEFFTGQILPPLLRGECLTVVWVPNLGMRTRMLYLIENSDKLGFAALGKYLIFHTDRNDLIEESSSGFFSLIEYRLSDKFPDRFTTVGNHNGTTVIALKNAINEIVKGDIHLIFLLGNFDKLQLQKIFYDNLKSLHDIDKRYIHFVFLCSNEITTTDRLEGFGQLKDILVQNIIYVPLLSPEDQIFTIDRLSDKYSYNLTSSQKQIVRRLGGGLPGLLRSLCRVVPQIEDVPENQLIARLLENQEISLFLDDIWNAMSEKDQNLLRLVAQGDCDIPNVMSQRVVKHGLVKIEGKKCELFSPLLELFIKSRHKKAHTLSVSLDSGEILLDNLPVAEKFTLQEYHLLTRLLTVPNKVFSRDEIGEALWGKESFDKYSDWAIDQIVSQTRKKIENIGLPPTSLQTIRGRGYRWLAKEPGESKT